MPNTSYFSHPLSGIMPIKINIMFKFLRIGGKIEEDQSRNEQNVPSDDELRREIQEEIFQKIDWRLFQWWENADDLDEGTMIFLIWHEGEVLDWIFSHLAKTKKKRRSLKWRTTIIIRLRFKM